MACMGWAGEFVLSHLCHRAATFGSKGRSGATTTTTTATITINHNDHASTTITSHCGAACISNYMQLEFQLKLQGALNLSLSPLPPSLSSYPLFPPFWHPGFAFATGVFSFHFR